MEEKYKIDQVNIEKVWNWNIDNNCALSCANVFIAHAHVINAVTLVMFLLLCYLTTCVINFIQYKKFTTTTETLLLTSVLIYAFWNIFFGFPVITLAGNPNDTILHYKSYAITQFMAILMATFILFFNYTC